MVWVDPKEKLIYIFLSNRVYPKADNWKLTQENIRTKVQQVIYESLLNKFIFEKFYFLFFTKSFYFFQKNIIDNNNLKQGYWELYFPRTDKVLSEKGFFIDDKEDGMWVRFHNNGNIREIVNFKDGTYLRN